MTTVIDILFVEFNDILKILDHNREISLRNTLESNFRKTLLLSAASFFETMLAQHVLEFCTSMSLGNKMVCSLVRIKVVERQYHTWFDWKSANANKFFSLFGEEFKEYARRNLDEKMDQSIKDFMEIGRSRNQMVHENYAGTYIEKTTEEIYRSYLSAKIFLDSVPHMLRNCSENKTDA